MSKLLVINAHPKVHSESAVSLRTFGHFIEAYKKLNPNGTIDRIDLYADEVPPVDAKVLSAWEKQARGEPLTAAEKRVADRMAEVVAQFKSADKYVIVLPLHNFNVPSKLKDYMDNILIARETFKYTKNGSVGLLKDGRSVLVIQGSGGIYTNDDWYTEVEYSHKFLKSMFAFMGIEDYRIVRAQGSNVRSAEEVLAPAFKEAEDAAMKLAGVHREADVGAGVVTV